MKNFLIALTLAVILTLSLGLKDPTEAGINSIVSVTSPMETAAVGFWFPGNGTFAAGLAHTVLRLSPVDMPKLTADIDVTIAQEVNQDKNTLGGIGFKLGYNLMKADKTGFNFIPTIGLTGLNDFQKFKTAKDIIGHYRIAVYGSALLYKW